MGARARTLPTARHALAACVGFLICLSGEGEMEVEVGIDSPMVLRSVHVDIPIA